MNTFKKRNYKYISKKRNKEIVPKFIKLDKSYLDRNTFELALQLKEKFGLPTMTNLINVAIHYLDETKDKGDKLQSTVKNIRIAISTINAEDSDFVEQSDLNILEKITKDTYGGIEH